MSPCPRELFMRFVVLDLNQFLSFLRFVSESSFLGGCLDYFEVFGLSLRCFVLIEVLSPLDTQFLTS